MQKNNIVKSYAKISINDEIITEQMLMSHANYVRVELSATNETNKTVLYDNRFVWVDRTIKAKIVLSSLEGFERLIRMDVREIDGISDDVYAVAKRAFKTDRRFFLDLDCEEMLGYLVLEDYIRQYENVKKKIFGCFYKEQLVGVLIAIQISDTEYETVLGAILPEWQSRGAGVSLYAYEFARLKDEGIKVLYSRISTDNVASMNLHTSLSKGNISFMQPMDVYIRN